jgi:hypothetical protein
MAKKSLHNKLKNTGILFELVTRQITADVLAGKSTKSVSIVKKFFNENTELGKELQLYRILLEKHYNSESKAIQLLDIVVKSRKKLNNSTLNREKYNLIKEIKKLYNINDFFNGRITNYKLLASIYNTFQSEITETDFNPKEAIDSKFTILEQVVNKRISTAEIKNKILTEYSKEDKDLRLLTYQVLVDKFNNKYKVLDENQKQLLKQYINNVSNTNSMREFIDVEVTLIKKRLKDHFPQITDQVTKIKLNEAINQVENLTKGKVVKETQVLTLMRYYQLLKELENVHKS